MRIAQSNQCLIDLSGSLERPAADAHLEERQAINDKVAFEVSGPAEIWTRKVIDSYPKIDVTLAERLGEANWKRYQRVSAMANDAESSETNSESEDTDNEGDKVHDLPDFTETTKSSADPNSIFSSAGRQTNTTGTSVSENAFDYAFPVARKRRAAKDLNSQATYTSLMTNDQGERGWLKIPAMPKAAELGKTFRCTVCGDKQQHIRSQTEWKKHVFADLQPYICTFPDCKGGINSFATRRAWSDHEFSVYRTTKIWICNDCTARFPERVSFREHAYSSHGNVLMRNQLEALVDFAEKPVGIAKDNTCPFCDEKSGTQSRSFAMHVARHMEEVALAVLPRDSEFEDDQSLAGSSISSSSLTDTFDLWEENLRGYDAHMLCALNMYVQDTAGRPLDAWTIFQVIGVSPKDSNGNPLSIDTVISYIRHHRVEVFSDVTERLKDRWKAMASVAYAEWLKRTFTNNLPQHDEILSTDSPSGNDPNWIGFAESRTGLENFNLLATIGKGNSARIMLAEHKDSKQLFAIKAFKKEFIIEVDEIPNVKVEKSVLLRATQEKHPFLVHLMSSFQTETRLFFVLEYVSGGDLLFHLQIGKFEPERAK